MAQIRTREQMMLHQDLPITTMLTVLTNSQLALDLPNNIHAQPLLSTVRNCKNNAANHAVVVLIADLQVVVVALMSTTTALISSLWLVVITRSTLSPGLRTFAAHLAHETSDTK
jgi:hypothetical protein